MSAAEQIDLLLASQDGVIARFQVLETGETDDLIARKVRRREWARVRPGC